MQHLAKTTTGVPAGVLSDFFEGHGSQGYEPYPCVAMEIPHMPGWKVHAYDIRARMEELVVTPDGPYGIFLSAAGMMPARINIKDQIGHAVEWFNEFLGQRAVLIHYSEDGNMHRYDRGNSANFWVRDQLRSPQSGPVQLTLDLAA